MATQRQIEANRLNAQKSTGPRTPEGKAVSRMNALKSGLDAKSQNIPGESPAEFAEFQQQYTDRYCPVTPDQRFLVDTLIRNEWLLRRLHRVEGQLWHFHSRQSERAFGMELGESFSRAGNDFMRLERRIRAAEKACKDALATLKRLQQESEPEQNTEQTPKSASFHTPDPASPTFQADMDHFIEQSLAAHAALTAAASPSNAPEPSPVMTQLPEKTSGFGR